MSRSARSRDPAVPRIALVGAGGMARAVTARLNRGGSPCSVGAVLVRRPVADPVFDGVTVLTGLEGLLAWAPDLVVECAGHDALRTLVPPVLDGGIDVVVASVGALHDAALSDRLHGAADRAGARLILPAGAVGGLDALGAAAGAALAHVVYACRKPPAAWKGTPAEAGRDLDRLTEPATLFEGSAREAARLYPKNANVAMAVALAGIGPDETRVRLIADPASTANGHEIHARGDFGEMSVSLANRPLPDNPRTSLLAALSVERAVRRWHAAW